MTEIPPLKKSHRLTVPSRDNTHKSTRNKVLDKKTLAILEKLQRRNILSELNGCISSGKEAEIYRGKIQGNIHCSFIRRGKKDDIFEQSNISESYKHNDENITETNKSQNVVLKIYRTSTIQFKNRSIYMSSEKRYPEYRKSSSRQMIKRWAEKEVRNLTRLYKSGVRTARPLYLKRNIILMEMIGDDDNVAIRLKDIGLSVLPRFFSKISNIFQYDSKIISENESYIENIYLQTLDIIYKMYNSANLIHCDLSEYNLLVHNGVVFVIDVGQSVDTTHNFSDVFLMNDILNINRFFKKQNVKILDHKILYEKVTGKEMSFELNGNEINKFGFEIDQEILLRDKNDNFSVNEEQDSLEDSTSSTSSNHSKDEESLKKIDANTAQFTKNKFLTKEEKIERRKNFKHERKMKRMCRDKKSTQKKKVQKRK